MESKFNMASVYKKAQLLDFKTLEVSKKAALLYHFDIEKDFVDFKNEDIEALEAQSIKRPDGLYGLRKNERMEILSKSIGVENLRKTIEAYNVRSDFANLINIIMDSRQVAIHEFSNAQVYYAIMLADILPEKLNKEELRRIYQRRQFFKTFERITRNFAGRKDELEDISDYVDWLPKSTIIGKITSVFRNIINWNEKPPLLIKGIGGIGKSTIVAKFILDQNDERIKKQLPFVYIDFDLPGFSIREPLTILIEALRQIVIQYPAHTVLINEISEHISEMIGVKEEGENVASQQTTASSRSYVYDSVQEVILNYDVQFKNIGKTPILIVFDSFEEMQYRATSSELHGFFNFIQEISELIPRIRPIFAGRAEISESFGNFGFETITIGDFDSVSANALLEKWDVKDAETRKFIYANFGGNPLMLLLAADLAKKKGFDLKNPDFIHGQKWTYLISRILGHIHDEHVEKIAVPGMLIRYVSPEIIQQILAVPTKLGEIDEAEAQRIYEELEKEVALISWSSGGAEFAFRQDLRMTCESTILEKYPKESQEIRKRAMHYYSEYDKIEDPQKRLQYKAEYYYHRLKSGDIPEQLTYEEYEEFRPFLEQAIIELPDSAKIFLRSLRSQDVAQSVIDSSTDKEWEKYHTKLIIEALNGELSQLEYLYKVINERDERINYGYTEFGKYEALLCQRLNKLKDSNKIILKAMSWAKDEMRSIPVLTLDFELMLVQNYEYEERYIDALDILSKYIPMEIEVDLSFRLKIYLLFYRMVSRLSNESNYEPNNQLSTIEKDLSTLEYRTNESFLDNKWEFLFGNLNSNTVTFKTHNELNREFRTLRKELRQLKDLEGYAYKHLGYFIKDITLTGSFDIVLRDYLLAKEIYGDRSVKTKS